MNAQSFLERPPVAALSRHVTCVWMQQVSPGSVPYTHWTVPNGSADLVCELGSAPTIVGPQTRPTRQMLAPGTIVVGIRFRPASVPSVLSVPTRELVDLRIGSDELWGRRAVTLGDRLAASRTPREAAALLEAEIVSRLADASDPDPVATETVRLLMPGRMTDVGRLPGALHISESQLRRRCQVAIGFAPKVLHRMLRFQGFLALAKQRERPSREVGVLAAEAGYADQSHLTRESVRLTGRSPGMLLRESERHCQSSHDHGASYGPLLQPHALGRAGSNV